MTQRHFPCSAVFIVVLLALAGPRGADLSGHTAVTGQGPPLLVAAATDDATSGSAECRPPSLANCYAEDGMLDYINVVQPMIVQFFRSTYRAMPEPNQYIYVPESGPFPESACQNENGGYLQDANAYAYCPSDENIYVGQAFMWSLYHDSG